MGRRTAGSLLRDVLVGLAEPVLVSLLILALRNRFSQFPLIFLFMPGLVIIAFAGGFVPGIVAAIASTLLVDYLFVEPPGFTLAEIRAESVPTMLFLVSGLLAVSAGAQARRYQRQLRQDLVEVQRRQQNETRITEVAILLKQEQEAEVLAEAACKKLAETLGDGCAIVAQRGEGRVSVVGFSSPGGARGERWRSELVPTLDRADDSLIQHLIEVQRPIIVTPDYLRVRGPIADSQVGQTWFNDVGVTVVLAVPLQFTAVPGYLAIFSEGARQWDEEDLRVARQVGDLTAVAIQQAWLRTQRGRQAREARFLDSLMVELSQHRDLPALLETVARRCTELLGEWCAIQLVDPDRPELRLGALHHADPLRVSRFRATLEKVPILKTSPHTARILESRQPVIASRDDPLVRELTAQAPALLHAWVDLEVHGGLDIPLVVDTDVLGILSIGLDAPRQWDERDLRMASVVAHRVAVAVQNARLHVAEQTARTHAEREARRMSAVNRIIAMAAQALDLGSVYDELADALQMLLPFVRLTVSLYEPEKDRLMIPYFKGPELGLPPDRLEGPKAGAGRGWVLDHGQALIRKDTEREQEFSEDTVLAAAGIRSYLILPMRVAGRAIGTLNFGHHRTAFYTEEHARLMQPIADQLAVTVSRFNLFRQVEQRAGKLSETLQRALLPAGLPSVPFVVLGATYMPADQDAQIGGDWYDAVILPDDTLLVSVGDVAGHGAGAAAAMGQVRHVVRAFALEGRAPAEMLRGVNLLLCRYPESPYLSIWIARLNPFSGDFIYAGSGHPPALILSNGQADFLSASGPPLGITSSTEYTEVRTRLAPGVRLIAYTDGLIEVTRDVIEGERRLVAAAQSLRAEPPQRAAETLVAQVLGTEGAPRDDIAAIVIDLLPLEAPLSLTLPATAENLQRIRRAVRALLERVRVPRAQLDAIITAVGEAALNVVEHAYRSGLGNIVVHGETQGNTLRITVRDFGRWLPQVERGRGRGTQIMKGFSDEMRTTTSSTGTIVELTWTLSEPGP